MTRPRLLILTASTGAGHISAARALHQAAERLEVESLTVDCMDVCTPGFRSWYRGGYERLVLKSPWFWGHLYRSSDRALFNYRFQTTLDHRFMDVLGGLVEEFRPDWVICTHSLPQPRLAQLRRKHGFRMAVVVTDMYPHRMWIRGTPDAYFVPSEWSREALIARIGPHPHAYVTGIPIGEEFSRPAMARPEGDPFRVLVSAGGIGGGPVVEVAAALTPLPFPAEIEVFCGGNAALLRAVSDVASTPRVQVVAVPRIGNDEMAVRMQAADLIVGKPGGLTTSEALACGLPFVVLDPCLIPGQEEKNAEFLVETGAGIRAHRVSDVLPLVRSLGENPARRQEMSRRCRELAQPQAAEATIRILKNL